MTKQQQNKIHEVVNKIVAEYRPEKIILFGSHAWGKPGKDSDIDLLVVKQTEQRALDREYELRLKLFGNKFPAMDILVYTPAELERRLKIKDFFFEDIINKGKVLYEAR